MNEILTALDTLVSNNCLTIAEALEKAFMAGHRQAVKHLEPSAPILISYKGEDVTPARGKSSK